MKLRIKSLLKKMMPERIVTFKQPREDKAVCLTFDDGPHKDHTEEILEVLNKGNIRATFFLNGCQVEKYPELAKKIVAAGHTVGNHFFDHLSASELDYKELKEQIENSEELIYKVTGCRPVLVRPPYGKINPALLWYALTGNKKLVLWSLDTEDGDAAQSSADSIADRLKNISSGDIVLMHEDNPHTVQALSGIVHNIQSQGFKFSAIPNKVGASL